MPVKIGKKTGIKLKRLEFMENSINFYSSFNLELNKFLRDQKVKLKNNRTIYQFINFQINKYYKWDNFFEMVDFVHPMMFRNYKLDGYKYTTTFNYDYINLSVKILLKVLNTDELTIYIRENELEYPNGQDLMRLTFYITKLKEYQEMHSKLPPELLAQQKDIKNEW